MLRGLRLNIMLVGLGFAASLQGMPYVKVFDFNQPGKPCLEFSKLVMGTDHLGKMSPEQSIKILDEAVRLGINTFDTSPIYTNGIENLLGRWLATKNDPNLHVITKGGFPFDVGAGDYRSRLSGSVAEIIQNVKEEVDTSFNQLNKSIAVYLMHRDDIFFEDYQELANEKTPAGNILKALSDPQLSNKYSMIGVSNWSEARVNEAITAAEKDPNLMAPVINSPYFSLFEMEDYTIHSGGQQVKHAQMMNPDFEPKAFIMPYSPLGGFNIIQPGWDAAKAVAAKLDRINERYWGNVYEAIFHQANKQRYDRAQAFLKTFNAKHKTTYTLDQLYNAYVLAHPRTDMLAIGPLTVEQLQRTVQSLELAELLTEKDLKWLYSGE